MNRILQRALGALALAGALVLSTTGPASAEPSSAGSAGAAVAADRAADITPASPELAARLALSCPSGNVCVWPNTGGTSNRCTWTNADADWRSGSVACSWSGTQPVRAAYNNGQSTAYDVVCLYRNANYSGGYLFLFQRGDSWTSSSGVFTRSHRWLAPTTPCLS
ncbi:peptidase inhibitor family I36 protein [Catenuloplanes atrovinosus]|uniref:Transcription elongation factor n=1 Tax=Catenuloplanes atrovinosus TaxID=137266 RepID=A0AAE4CA11_9ACTN|nr:peptidase inhibitor family I36 protein [Catenuloplanes atrovinosus]MDR7276402.1 transcription elongation factor [Catenuloplanes atrovinosus]